MAKECLCIDVGGTSIKYAIINNDLVLSEHGKVKTPYEGVDKYLETLHSIYQKFEGKVEGISLSVPGIIDSKNGICISAGSLVFADGIHLVEELEKRCHVPVKIMNDAKCAAFAEASWGSLSDCKDGIVIALGTGIGGALVKDGKVHMGNHMSAGEFSWLAIGDDVDQPSNCWGVASGNRRLLSMAASVKGVDPETISGEDVFEWANSGDTEILNVLDQFTKTIARMIFNLQAIYDPERIAIGGGISRQPLLLQYILKNLDYFYKVFFIKVPQAQITTCKFFNEANLLGAYRNYLEN
jgi:predicted NBD/HSP70 family sugar kinase